MEEEDLTQRTRRRRGKKIEKKVIVSQIIV